MPKSWFTAQLANGKTDTADIAIYDLIGYWGVNSRDFRDSLAALGEDVKTINLRINSPGGEVYEGIAVANMLARHPARVVVTIDGIAASIASVVAVMGDEVQMPENSMMFVHDPSGGVWGTADDMRQWADGLDKMAAGMVATYAAKTGLPDDEIRALLKAETWLTAAEAKAKGFADTVLPARRMQARFDPAHLKSPPAAVKSMFKKPRAESDPADQPASDPADPPADPAPTDPAPPSPEPSPQPEPQPEDPAVAAAKARATLDNEILAACELAGHGIPVARKFITEGKPLAQVRAELQAMPRGHAGGREDEINARRGAGQPPPPDNDVMARAVDRINARFDAGAGRSA